MFTRTGDLQILAAAYNNETLNALKKDWQDIVRGSGSFCQKGSCPFVVEGSFAYDPENFLYYRARAITADVPNGNGDLFPLAELEASFSTFIGQGVYLNHDSDSPDKSFGLVLDSVMHKPLDKLAYIEILAAIDKEIAEQKHPGIVRKLSNGFLNSTSMGCSCFPKDTLITMGDGTRRPIEDVQEGDEVISHTGHVRAVSNLQKRMHSGKAISVKVYGVADPIVMTPEHPVLVKKIKCLCGCGEYLPAREDSGGLNRASFSKGHHGAYINVFNGKATNAAAVLEEVQQRVTTEYTWVNAEDLSEDDVVLFPKFSENTASDISVGKARLLGYFLAEGSYLKHKGNKTAIEFNFNESELETLVKEVTELLKTEFNCSPCIYVRSDRHTVCIRVNDKDIANIFYKYCGEYSYGKKLSNDIFAWNTELQLNLLGAYFNGDGCSVLPKDKKNSRLQATSASKELIDQLKIICSKNAIRFNVSEKYSPREWKQSNRPYYTLVIPTIDAIKLSKFSKFDVVDGRGTPRTYSYDDLYLCRPITEIEEIDINEYVYNFEVEEDHSYIAGDIAVHNCTHAECGICHNVAYNTAQLCSHMHPDSLSYTKGKRQAGGAMAHEINYGVTFTEDSVVQTPADFSARIMEIFANKRKVTTEDIKNAISELNI